MEASQGMPHLIILLASLAELQGMAYALTEAMEMEDNRTPFDERLTEDLIFNLCNNWSSRPGNKCHTAKGMSCCQQARQALSRSQVTKVASGDIGFPQFLSLTQEGRVPGRKGCEVVSTKKPKTHFTCKTV